MEENCRRMGQGNDNLSRNFVYCYIILCLLLTTYIPNNSHASSIPYDEWNASVKNVDPPKFSEGSSHRTIYIPENISPGTAFHRVIASDQDLLPFTTNALNSSALNFKSEDGPFRHHLLQDGNVGGIRGDGKRYSSPSSFLSYRIISGNEKQVFSIEARSGELRTFQKLDREKIPSYDLFIAVTDGIYTASCSLTIRLLDVNDNRPVFEKNIYTAFINVQGYWTRDKQILTVKANDADLNDTVHYTLNVSSASSEASLFNINSTSGVISANLATLIQAQNRQQRASSLLSRTSTFSFTVFALDSGTTLTHDSVVSNATVMVTFTHTVPATSPKLKHYPYIIELDGHRSDFRVGAQIGRIEFPSLGGASSIRIEVEDHPTASRCSDYFQIDSKTGSMIVIKNLNSNFYECFLHIKGSEEAPVTTSLLQVFFLRGISSEAKARKANAFSLQVEVSEDLPPGSQVVNIITLSRIHSLKSGQHTFNLSYSSLDSSYFDLNATTGELVVKKSLDYEVLPSKFELVAVAYKTTDPFDNPIYFNITINLSNVNDHPPIFTQKHYFASLPEGQARGILVAPVFARDIDTVGVDNNNLPLIYPSSSSDTSSLPVRYHIEEGNLGNAFVIDPSTGIVKTNAILHREIRSQFLLRIVATDSSLANESRPLSSSCILEVMVLNINDDIVPMTTSLVILPRPSTPRPSSTTTNYINSSLHLLSTTASPQRNSSLTEEMVVTTPSIMRNESGHPVISTGDINGNSMLSHTWFVILMVPVCLIINIVLLLCLTRLDSIRQTFYSSSSLHHHQSSTATPHPHINFGSGDSSPSSSPRSALNFSKSSSFLLPNPPFTQTYMSHMDTLSGRSLYSTTTTCHGSHHYMPAPEGSGRPPPCYSQITNSTTVEGTSASSGRGSTDDNDEQEADEEIRMIIQGGGYGCYQGKGNDLQQAQQPVISVSEYLARIGVTDHSGEDVIPPPALQQVREEEEHEVLDYDDIASENWGELNPRSKRAVSTGSLRSVRRDRRKHGGRRRHYRSHSRGDLVNLHGNPPVGLLGPHQEEILEIYNHDYLSNWQPKYQTLTAVFDEIAKLKGTAVECAYNQPYTSRQSPLHEQSFLSRLETSSTISASTNNSSLRRGPTPGSRLSTHNTPTAISVNNPYSNGSFMTNPLIQPSQTSAFSPVSRSSTNYHGN